MMKLTNVNIEKIMEELLTRVIRKSVPLPIEKRFSYMLHSLARR